MLESGFAFRLPARLAVALAALTGQEPEMTPEGVEMVIARAKVVSDLAQRELSYKVVPLRKMIEDCYGWLKGGGLIKTTG